jgi:hypothetical protein
MRRGEILDSLAMLVSLCHYHLRQHTAALIHDRHTCIIEAAFNAEHPACVCLHLLCKGAAQDSV